ncbi:hypothetical protein [Luteimonas sp. e5]
MNKFEDIAQRAAHVAGEVSQKAGELAAGLGSRAAHLGGDIKGKLPDAAMRWLETGAALAAVRTGGRTATRFVRRNPGVVVAAAAAGGLLWYATRRHAKKKAEEAAIEGTAKRIDARRRHTRADADDAQAD